MVDYKFKKIGIDVRVDNWVKITKPELVSIGDHVSIDMGVYLSVSAEIGSYIHIAPHVTIIGGADAILIMENFTSFAAGSKIICAGDDFTDGFLCPFIPIKYRHVINKPIIFKKFSGVGVNSTVMPGVIMAEGSVLGANSVLTKNTEPWMVYVGSPAVAVKIRKSELILKGAKELGY